MTTLNLNNKLALDEIQQVDSYLQQQIDDINTQIGDIPAIDARVTALETNDGIQDAAISAIQNDLQNLTLGASLTDVDVTGLQPDQILKYDGTKWIPAADSNGIPDVSDSQNYAWTQNDWVLLNLDSLADVYINDPP